MKESQLVEGRNLLFTSCCCVHFSLLYLVYVSLLPFISFCPLRQREKRKKEVTPIEKMQSKQRAEGKFVFAFSKYEESVFQFKLSRKERVGKLETEDDHFPVKLFFVQIFMFSFFALSLFSRTNRK